MAHAPTRTLHIETSAGTLDADLTIPPHASGIVAFAHGSGSSRGSPRNRAVAAGLQFGGLATLLFDLLTPAEAARDERSRALRFDIALLAGRLIEVSDWLATQAATATLPLGLFGASTGAAAALIAAAERPEHVAAVVSRGGRPDLAAPALERVQAPTLLIVGERDPLVLDLNRDAQRVLGPRSRLALVARAGHLFEEPGALEQVTDLARDWFIEHLRSA